MSDLLKLEDAQEKVLSLCQKLEAKKLKLKDALGKVAAEDILAKEAVPPFDNSAMDGFALKAADTESGSARLEIIGEAKAGKAFVPSPPAEKLQNGQAVRIMTGAPIPPGADSILEVEATGTDGPDFVLAKKSVAVGSFIRRAGEDVVSGDTIITKGDVINPARLGVLASQGIYELSVYPECRVAVLSTGSELIDGPQELKAGQIRDSNRYTLLALVKKLGMQGHDLGLVSDTEASISEAFREASKKYDLLLTSGGVSMGDFDFVKKVLVEAGGEAIKIAIKPSKPLAFGKIGDMVVLGLPGNPVSSAVSFELFASPCIKKLMGFSDLYRKKVRAVLAEDFRRSPDGKTHFVRVSFEYADGKYSITQAGKQGSHMLTGLAGANGLAVLEDGEGKKTGEEVDLILI